MKFHEEVILSSFIGFVLLPKLSKKVKPEDCIPLKQYWSIHFINEDGTCSACPLLFETCSEQGVDRKSCEDSCFAKNPPYTRPKYSSVPSLNVSTPADQTKKHKEKTTHFDINVHPWVIALVVLLALLVFLALIFMVVLPYIRKFKKPDENVKKGMVLEMELLRRNSEGDQNNGEVRVHVPDDIEGCVPNDNEEHLQEANADGRTRLPNDAGPVQEQERSFITQPTASKRLIKGILEENFGSSLDVHVESYN